MAVIQIAVLSIISWFLSMGFELFAQILAKNSLRFLNWYLNITFEPLSLSFPTFSFPSTEFRFFLLHANQPPHFPSAKHFPFFPPNFFTVLWRANFVTGLFWGCSFAVKEPKKVLWLEMRGRGAEMLTRTSLASRMTEVLFW